jgi:nicotinate phosphoribosyltransferase
MRTFSPALLTDLYQLTMAQAYLEEGMSRQAVFSLFVRRLPPTRNYLLACGLDDALTFLETLRFDGPALNYLASLGTFSSRFLRYLEDLRFTGQVRAVPEGTPVFSNEPILEVTAPIIEAQIVETFVMNQINLQTVVASKAIRVVEAAQGRQVVDFGLRRMHGIDAGMKAARAFHIAGVDATSNVAAGQVYGLRTAGTMAHSYIQAHESEYEAFRAFARQYPQTVLLVDTYDTLAGVRKVIDLAKELGSNFHVKAVRLDSGSLLDLSICARQLLDDAGLQSVEIFASGNLDEHAIAGLLAREAPIDGFGVGTEMGVSPDAPVVDLAYKLAEYEGRGRVKLAPEKSNLPGAQQVFRMEHGGFASHDVIAQEGEPIPGRPLLRSVMIHGARVEQERVTLDHARARTRAELERLPSRLRSLAPADPPYDVRISAQLTGETERLRQRYAHESGQ